MLRWYDTEHFCKEKRFCPRPATSIVNPVKRKVWCAGQDFGELQRNGRTARSFSVVFVPWRIMAYSFALGRSQHCFDCLQANVLEMLSYVAAPVFSARSAWCISVRLQVHSLGIDHIREADMVWIAEEAGFIWAYCRQHCFHPCYVSFYTGFIRTESNMSQKTTAAPVMHNRDVKRQKLAKRHLRLAIGIQCILASRLD